MGLLLVAMLAGCSPILTPLPESSTMVPDIPPPADEAEARAMLKDVGKDLIYGETPGVVATAILVPPYGIYKLGQAGAAMAGYDLDVTRALPEKSREKVNTAGSMILSVPGRAAAAIAGEEYRGKGVIVQRYAPDHLVTPTEYLDEDER